MVVLGAESHDRGLDGVVNADVETGVRSVAQDGGDESGEQSALVDSQDVPASVEDGVIRHLVELHSRYESKREAYLVFTRVIGSIIVEQIERAQKPAPRE